MPETVYVPTLPKTMIAALRRFAAEPVHVFTDGSPKPGNGVPAPVLLRLQREDMITLTPGPNPEAGQLIRLTDAGHRVLAACAESAAPQLAAVAAAR